MTTVQAVWTTPAARDVWAAPVVGAVCGYSADVFVFGDLVQKVRQDAAVAFPAWG